MITPEHDITTTDHPLDTVEQILHMNEWQFDRADDDELAFTLRGQSCTYRIFFIWDAALQTMQMCCQYDFKIDLEASPQALLSTAKINEQLWLGHFDIPSTKNVPCFRYASLMHGVAEDDYTAHLEHVIDIALAQCEQYYPALHMLSGDSANDNPQGFNLAMMDVQGHS